MHKKIPVRIERLANAIAQYLAANPHAADTVEGIHSWWLSGVPPDARRDDVERAVGALVQRGILECRMLPDGVRVYAVAQPLA